MHSCNTCGSCTNLDRNLAYLTDPPQYKCKESGRLHFQSDICDITQEDNEFWIDNGNQTGGQNMEDKVENIEYIRKEDAKSVTWKQPSYTDPLNILTEVRDWIESIKPADVAPVVRCKDCQYLDTVDDEVGICHHVNGFGGVMPKDGFCSRGERKR